MALQNNVKNYLKSKHITVPDEWIGPCVEWIQEDNPGINMGNTRVILEKVYEQWLHADLTQLASCCLPFGLAQKRSTTINGQFVLQVNQIRDVGHPAYSQLQKLRKSDNANASVSADKQYQSSWEAKPTRMLMMQMTDGTSMVQGMEYRSIPHLNINLKPGAKVLISGAINARRGILLLTREHITILGGETESLGITNAVENVLARALGAEETEEPKEMEEIVATQIAPSQASQYYPSQVNRAPPRSQNALQPARGRGGGGPPLSINRQQNITTTQPTAVLDDLGDDDFLDDDLEAALNQIESQAGSSVSNSSQSDGYASGIGNHRLQGTNNRNMSNNSVRTSNTLASTAARSGTSWQDSEFEMDVGDEFFNDDFDDELLLSVESLENQKNTQASSSSAQPVRNFAFPSTAAVKPLSHRPNTNMSRPAGQRPLFGNQNNFSTVKHSTPIRAVAPQKMNKPGSSTLSSSKNSKVSAKQPRLTNFLTKSSSSQSSNKASFNSAQRNTLDDDDVMEEDGYAMPLESRNNTNRRNSADGRDLKRQKTMMPSDTVTQQVKREPFTYLFFLPERPSQTQEYVVKGFIMTLVSKLEISNGKWKLTAAINDGSASREVDIDHEILRRLIGMTGDEFQERKRESKLNPALQLQLSKSVSGCQQKLIALCSLLKLSVSPDSPRPRLIEIIPVNYTTAMKLSQRSSSSL